MPLPKDLLSESIGPCSGTVIQEVRCPVRYRLRVEKEKPNDRYGPFVTHGRLAEEMIAALEHVVGPQVGAVAVCIGPDDDMEQKDVMTS